MGKGVFINRKLAKGPGHAQRKARLALESKQKSKAVSISERRDIIKNEEQVPRRSAPRDDRRSE
jgi:hypothetical protein